MCIRDSVQIVPVQPRVEPHTDPSPVADVRGHEEPVRVLIDHVLLRPRQRRAPQVRELVRVVPVEPRVHEGRLTPDEEARGTVAQPLGRLGERKADLPQAAESLLRVLRGLARWHARSLSSRRRSAQVRVSCVERRNDPSEETCEDVAVGVAQRRHRFVQ